MVIRHCVDDLDLLQLGSASTHTHLLCVMYTHLHPHTVHYEQLNTCTHKCLIAHLVMTLWSHWLAKLAAMHLE